MSITLTPTHATCIHGVPISEACEGHMPAGCGNHADTWTFNRPEEDTVNSIPNPAPAPEPKADEPKAAAPKPAPPRSAPTPSEPKPSEPKAGPEVTDKMNKALQRILESGVSSAPKADLSALIQGGYAAQDGTKFRVTKKGLDHLSVVTGKPQVATAHVVGAPEPPKKSAKPKAEPKPSKYEGKVDEIAKALKEKGGAATLRIAPAILTHLAGVTAKRGTPVARLKDKAKKQADEKTADDGSILVVLSLDEAQALREVSDSLLNGSDTERGAKTQAAARIRRLDQILVAAGAPPKKVAAK